MNKNTLVGIILVIIVALGGFLYLKNSGTNNKSGDYNKAGNADNSISPQQNMPVIGSTTPETVVSQEVTVTYTDDGFNPSSIEINKGDTVKFLNQSSGKMWVATAAHPTHSVYSGTTLSQHCPDTESNSFDQCQSVSAPGSWSFTFDKTGNWKYHNHDQSSAFGTIIVK